MKRTLAISSVISKYTRLISLFILLGLQALFFVHSMAQPPTIFKSRGIGGGGALFAPSINPANHSEIFMGCDMTELFHSSDMGGHWSELPFKQIQGGHDAQVQFTNNSNLLYCVDYSTINNVDELRPMKSTDGGYAWSVLSGNPYSLQPTSPLRLFADYHHPTHVVIADYGTIYFSSDGGSSFSQIHTCISNGAGNHIAGVFFDSDNIYIGTNDGIIYTNTGGLPFSTLTTSGITSGQNILSFAGAKEGGTTRFVCLTSTSVYAGIQGSDYWGELDGIYVMDNASGTWTAKLGGVTMGSDYPFFVGMAENDIDTMYCAGGNSSGNPIVMRSVGNGNWTHVFLTANNQNIFTGWAGQSGDHQWSYPEAPFGFQVCSNDSRMVIFTDYSDAHVTTDGGETWHQKYVDAADENPLNAATPIGKKYHGIGLENTTNWQVMWIDTDHLFGAFSDIGNVMSDDQGASWSFTPNLKTQNSTYRMVKHTNGNIYACTSGVHDMYQTPRIYDAQINAGTGQLWVSSNGGVSFTSIHSFNGVAVWIALDPINSDRMYAAVANSDTTKGGIWKTNNLSAGASAVWTRCVSPPRTQGHAFNIHVLSNGDLLASFSARKPTSGTSFTQSSGVFYSIDGGNSWSDRTDAAMKYYTKDVVIDPNDATGSTWYACTFQAWGSGVSGNLPGLFKTTNKGMSWTHILSDLHVNSCTINPSNASEMYVCTEADGLLYSNNINSASPTFSLVDAYDFRHPVRVFFNPYKPGEMWVSAFGAGMKLANLSCGHVGPAIIQNENLLTSSNADSYQWLLNGIQIVGADQQTYTAIQSGSYAVELVETSGCISTSPPVSVLISGLGEMTYAPDGIRIFPNPTSGDLHLVLLDDLLGEEVTVSDLSGRILMHHIPSSSSEILKTAELNSGLYFIRVKCEVKRFIKL